MICPTFNGSSANAFDWTQSSPLKVLDNKVYSPQHDVNCDLSLPPHIRHTYICQSNTTINWWPSPCKYHSTRAVIEIRIKSKEIEQAGEKGVIACQTPCLIFQ